MIRAAAILAALAGGCKKPEADAKATVAAPPDGMLPAGCGPLAITVDGVAVTNLHGLAVTLKNGVYETEQVELYDTDRVTCAEVLAPSYAFPAGAVSLRAYYHPQAQGLGTEAYTAMGVSGIRLIAKAAKVGDPTSICVPAGSTFTPSTGSFAGKKVDVSGRLTGVYCGVKDAEAR